MARLLEQYREEILPRLMEEFGFKNVHEAPYLEKIVVNMGVGEALADSKLLDAAVADLTRITGQKPAVTRARRSVAGFKLRAGNPVGAKVTLRGARMYEFLDRLISVAIPRIRDFRGVNPRSFDQAGNYTLGVTEQGIFPEIDLDSIERVRGMDICIVIANGSPEASLELLRGFGMPFAEPAGATR
jgi:large subunit ribosomal protein L5